MILVSNYVFDIDKLVFQLTSCLLFCISKLNIKYLLINQSISTDNGLSGGSFIWKLLVLAIYWLNINNVKYINNTLTLGLFCNIYYKLGDKNIVND